jgi:hypothetical protein
MSDHIASECYEQFTANVHGRVRRETFNGQSYLVAPMTLLQAGHVLNGSQGPLLYPAEEVAKNPGVWNNIPITNGHPTDEQGNPTWARSPKILERYQLGHVFNDTWNGSSRDAEGWFNEAWTKERAPRVYKLLQEGKSFDLSTGLKTRNQPVRNGSHANGKAYSHVARDYVPDHLAALSDQQGACSRKDGCGVFVGNESTDEKRSIWNKLGSLLGITDNAFCATGKGGGQDNSCGSHEGGSGGDIPKHAAIGKMVKIKLPHASGKQMTVAGIVKTHKDGGKVEVKTQQHGYYVVHNSEIVTNSEGDDIMPTKKEELVSFLTTNCSCHKGKEKVLNQFDEETLNAFKEQYEELKASQLVVNTLRETNPKLKDVALNEMPAAYAAVAKKPEASVCPECKGMGEDCTCKKEPMMTPVKNTLAPAEQRLTPEEIETLSYARKLINNSKAQLVELVVNALGKDDAARKAIRPLYERMSHEDLETVKKSLPPTRNAQPGKVDELMDFFGASGGSTVVNSQRAELDQDDVLEPTINWAAEEAKAAAKASGKA